MGLAALGKHLRHRIAERERSVTWTKTDELAEAAYRGDDRLCQQLLRSGVNPNVVPPNELGLLPIDMALLRADRYSTVAMLLSFGADPNLHDKDHAAVPLSYAARFGKERETKLLIRYGAHINAGDSRGNTPLHWAAQYGKCAEVGLLLSLGANRSIRNQRGETPLESVRTVEYGVAWQSPSRMTGLECCAAALEDLPLRARPLPWRPWHD